MLTVIDTNVFVGACMGVGACNAVVRACLTGSVAPVMGAALMAEFEDVLGRDALFANSRLDASERGRLLDIFLSRCEWTRVYYLWRPNLRDEGDNHLIELAVAAGAPFIVSRNVRDLRSGQLPFAGLQVMTPDAFLKEI
ncbi:MAG: PIN domain-containing protein [Burkholderiales bacterium]|nr:PIN domain-containing protein [Burkholderiales bacterium]